MTARPPVCIQPVTPDDAPVLAEVALRSYRQHYLHLWHDGGAWYIDRCFTVEGLRREMAEPGTAWFLVQLDGQPAGFIKLNTDKPLNGTDSRHALELERIYLVREATGRGVGRAALTAVIDYARQRGNDLIWLKAMDTSTGVIAAYRRLGFVNCGTHQLEFAQMKPEFRGMVVMQQRLSPNY